MSKINPKSLVSILTVICIVISMICSKPIRAVTEGRGARIVIWDEWGQAKFHIGMTPGSHVKLTAEATGQAEISGCDFSFFQWRNPCKTNGKCQNPCI